MLWDECEEEGVAETMCDELIATPIPHPSALLQWTEVENPGVSPGRREGWRKGVFKIWVYFSLSYSYLICNKLNEFPQVESVLPMTVIGE